MYQDGIDAAAGDGLQKSGSTLSVKADGTTISVSASGVKVNADLAVTTLTASSSVSAGGAVGSGTDITASYADAHQAADFRLANRTSGGFLRIYGNRTAAATGAAIELRGDFDGARNADLPIVDVYNSTILIARFLSAATSGGSLELYKVGSDPANGPAGTGRLFIKDDGGGKMQLAWRPPGGAVRVLDTEV